MSIPNEPHWAIITTVSTHIPGDERSRTNPGHGYPAHTVESINYKVFTDRQKWERAIADLMKPKYGNPRPFTAIKAIPARITTSVQIQVS